MPWNDLLEAARGQQLVTTSNVSAQAAEVAGLPSDLHPALIEALRTSGVEQLYSHQAAALEAARHGHTVVTTGTASGKSLAFNMPVLDTLAHDPRARALYLYPTKALAQDQARKLSELRARFLRHAIYDGDTPRDERRAIRGRSNLILTNPDMLHIGVLPHHRNWGDVLANLAWVVVDEAHVYRGVFGSHVANVLRRLRRLANAYGTQPRLMLPSAALPRPRGPPSNARGAAPPPPAGAGGGGGGAAFPGGGGAGPPAPRGEALRGHPAAGGGGQGFGRVGLVGGGRAAGGADGGGGAAVL